MKTVSITKDLTSYYLAEKGDTTYVLEKDASITTSALAGLFANTDVSNRDFVIKGDISASQGSAIHIGSYDGRGAGVLTLTGSANVSGEIGVKLVADGQIVRNAGNLGGEIALQWSGGNTRVENSGTINGANFGIDVSSEGGRIVNSGLITGQNGGIRSTLESGEELRIVNKGDIMATDNTAVRLLNTAGSTTELVNHGDISGKFWSIQSGFATSTEIIRNRGEISESIWLGGGDDIFDGRGGHALYVDGGEQDDLYMIDDPLIKLAEQTNAGTDTVRSSVTWTLGSNFENLIFTGSNSLTGKGNDSANRLSGNAGQNTLYGYGGMDIVSGGRGDDALYGGALGDTFVFATGTGHDRIMDFSDGVDLIDITGIKGISTFDQISDAMVQNGANVEIDFGKAGMITIEKVSVLALTAEDFAY